MRAVRIEMRLACLVSIVALAFAGCDSNEPTSNVKAEAEPPEQSASAEDFQKEGATPNRPGDGNEGKDSTTPSSLDDLPEGTNVLQHEMQLLTSSMQTILTLIANDSLEGVPAQIKRVHPARQLTVKALEAGEYEPPKSADDLETFKQLDDQFHENLKKLLKASKEDDLPGATKAYGDLVQGCTNCHTQFRFETP